MEIRALLFDLDGVLMDTLECWFRAYNDTYKKYGLSAISREEFLRKYWGHSYERGIGHLGEDALRHCNDKFIENLKAARRIPGSVEVLEFCREKVKLGLVTNTPRSSTMMEIGMFGFGGYFDIILTGDDVVNKKPSPDMILKACGSLGVLPENTILIGDTESDLRAGKGAGCRVIGINTNAEWTVKDMFELRGLLARILKSSG